MARPRAIKASIGCVLIHWPAGGAPFALELVPDGVSLLLPPRVANLIQKGVAGILIGAPLVEGAIDGLPERGRVLPRLGVQRV